MKPRTVIPIAIAVLSGSILGSGCVFSIGSHGEPPGSRQPTQGQELIDLKKAHDAGALTDQEYEAARTKALNK